MCRSPAACGGVGQVMVNANRGGREPCGQAADFALKLHMVVENPANSRAPGFAGVGERRTVTFILVSCDTGEPPAEGERERRAQIAEKLSPVSFRGRIWPMTRLSSGSSQGTGVTTRVDCISSRLCPPVSPSAPSRGKCGVTCVSQTLLSCVPFPLSVS